MSKFEDFKAGDRVAHITLGDGWVTAVDECVHVTYDRKLPNGARYTGDYGPDWFKAAPGYLFHRRLPTEIRE